MKYFFALLIILCNGLSLCFAQTTFNRKEIQPIVKLKSVDFSTIDDVYLPALVSKEVNDVSSKSSKKFLNELKKKIAIEYPKNDTPIVSNRGNVDPPEIDNGFIVFGVQPGIPLDNHLAMHNDTIVTAINSFISINNSSGGFIKNFSLASFASQLGFNDDSRLFDPRLIFDPIEQKYVAVFLFNSSSLDSEIVVCFSETSDANGIWHCYLLTGNPNMDNTWTDYPMVNFTEDDMIITVNLLRDNESWQLGFEESLIWQLDKKAGFNGGDIGTTLWDDINFEGASIRNLCPVESGTSAPLQSSRFLSNRNFDIENDTIFYLHLQGSHDDPNATLTVDYILADVPYGVPPNATQNGDALQTNDARVLEAFIVEDQIQFVGNTRNLTNNQAGIYHGVINGIDGLNELTLTHIIGEDYELGYPGIIYTGDGIDERDAIIAFDHTSFSRNPGVSAMYYDPNLGYSDIISIIEGQAPCEMLPPTVDSIPYERWGDYLGTQRNFNDPDQAWIAGFHTLATGNNHPYIASVRRPMPFSSNEEIEKKIQTKVFPNPVGHRVFVELEIPVNTQKVSITLLDINGKRIDSIMETKPKRYGKNEFSFNVSSLAQGIYQLNISMDDAPPLLKKIVVH